MSNNSALRCSRRRVLASVNWSILRYRVTAWKAALSRQCILQKLCSVQRLVNLNLVISGYGTVSSVAADVVARVMPVSAMLEEDIFCYEHRHMPHVRKHAKEASMSNWQHQLDSLEHVPIA
ncbi:uncharacterized protein LOC129743078 [Uranotaenia lowii]|uniref:uncharacterized protein LOC129743078 n=1 Tax=Uranotaenia lowii TaxID=190385 RepID=UPI00247852D2|nr:uncharacterized protein LOC129743078 [Uranotaenia lowii]